MVVLMDFPAIYSALFGIKTQRSPGSHFFLGENPICDKKCEKSSKIISYPGSFQNLIAKKKPHSAKQGNLQTFWDDNNLLVVGKINFELLFQGTK